MSELFKIMAQLSRWRVRAAIPAVLLVLIFARPTSLSLIIGLAFCFLGLLMRAWAAGHLHKNASLATSGPYRFSRNPLYLGNFILGLGLVASANFFLGWLIFMAYFLAFYPAAILQEKHKMVELFPEQYQEYSQKVPVFFPRLRPSFLSGQQKFRLALYFKNKEYRAFLAIIGFWLLLLFKQLFWLKP